MRTVMTGLPNSRSTTSVARLRSVAIYVQETVVPRAIVEDLRRAGPIGDDVRSLFDDFDGLDFGGLDFGESIDFYAHDANWSNQLILGDSLLAVEG